MMLNILYTLIIFPIEQIIELFYVFIFRLIKSPGFSIIGLSIVVSTLLLPISIVAEKNQKNKWEKERQKKDIENKKKFSKKEKFYMLLSFLLYVLRSNLALLIQILFFVAAYHFFTNLEIFNGKRFKFINDLGVPDGLLLGKNLLPIIMLLINIVSGYIYTRGLEVKDKIQVYGIAAVLIILLYKSPAAFVLYWIFNNIYDLVKYILIKTKNTEIWVKGLVLFVTVSISIFLLFIREGSLTKRLFIVALLCIIVLLLFVWKRVLIYLKQKIDIKNTALEFSNRTFLLSLMGLFLLIGLVIPSSVIVSSVQEFSFLEPFSSPLPYLVIVLIQAMGILFWLIFIYFLFGKKIRILLTIVLTVAFGLFVLNNFVFTAENYGLMASDLTFIHFKKALGNKIFINIAEMLALSIAVIILLVWKKQKVLLYLQCIFLFVFFCFGIQNTIKINKDFKNIPSNKNSQFSSFEKIFTFTKTGKNILLVILDNFSPGYIPYIFEEKPELLKSFVGFIHYPNTVSFSYHTIRGMPPIWGGYSYSPLEMQKRKSESWRDKWQEANQVLPVALADAGFNVALYNQYWNKDRKIYDKIKNIKARFISGRYNKIFLKNNKDTEIDNPYNILRSNFIRFSFFKTSPLILHEILYDKGNYLKYKKRRYSTFHIAEYAYLNYLLDCTEIVNDNVNQAMLLLSSFNCYPTYLEAPDYTPTKNRINGEGSFAHDGFYHVNMASLLLLAKWFGFLKENGVYDNTRIILVSDHPNNNESPFPNNIKLPDGKMLDSYNALLMVKDFDMDFDLRTDNSFMTNADVPHLAANGFFQDFINPFTKKKIFMEKENGVFIASSPSKSEVEASFKQTGDIITTGWLHVHTNIFDPSNWSIAEVEY